LLAEDSSPAFNLGLTETKLPELPDDEAANRILIKTRREMASLLHEYEGKTMPTAALTSLLFLRSNQIIL
jgi:hypothetical protein